jgi:hypothetical protein
MGGEREWGGGFFGEELMERKVNSRQLKERARKKKEFTTESTEDAEKRGTQRVGSWELRLEV